jgi:hypothetical protein
MQKCILHRLRRCWQVLRTFKLPLKGLREFFFREFVITILVVLGNYFFGYLVSLQEVIKLNCLDSELQ